MKQTLYHGSRKITVDTNADTCLYAAARHAPSAQGIQNWGKDLYMHALGTDEYFYYFHLVPFTPTGKEKVIPVSPVMAERFLQRRGLTCSPFPANSPVSRLYSWGYGIAEEF